MSWPETCGLVLSYCLASFGEEILYLPRGQPAISLTGIFDELYEGIDPNTNAIVTSRQPILGIRDSDLGRTPRQEDQVQVRGILYRVKEVQADGQGGSKLYLHRVN